MNIEIDESAVLMHVNNRVEHHGEDRVLAADIDLKITDIAAGELDQFALDGNMISSTLWNKATEDDLVGGLELGSPKLGLLKAPLTIDCEAENHEVAINIETDDEQLKAQLGAIHINPAKIKKIKFTPKHQGMAEMTLQVAGNLNGHEIGKVLDKYLGERVSIKITPGANAQSSLLDDDGAEKAA